MNGAAQWRIVTGRPSKLTPELQEQICALLEQGWFLHHAAAVCQVASNTVHEWIARGESRDPDRPPEPEYEAFAIACACARAKGTRVYLESAAIKAEATSRDMNPGDHKYDLWMAERLDPKLHLSTKTELTGAEGGPLAVRAAVVVLPPEEPLVGKKE